MSSLKERIKQQSPILDDMTYGVSDRLQFLTLLKCGKFGPAQASLESLTDRHVRDHYLDITASFAEQHKYAAGEWLAHLGREIEAAPDNGLLRLARARLLIQWAWNARGSGVSSSVGEDAADLFLERLEAADADCEAAGRLLPGDPSPAGLSIYVAKGLGLDDQLNARLGAVNVEAADAWPAYRYYLSAISEKWLGSHDKMFAFARSMAGGAGSGSAVHGLIAAAHFEAWLFYGHFSGDDMPPDLYFSDPQVQEELTAAWDAFKAANHPIWLVADDLNFFAICFHFAKMRAPLTEVLLQLYPYARTYPMVFAAQSDGPAGYDQVVKTATGSGLGCLPIAMLIAVATGALFSI